ncbi:magnesium transporter MRS2-11, chloroplastic isoform X1 [Morus notabilis]|uniref:magnesium transporter MRS2-11, chloroplastic isoform X1 n=1 Tax=Morus notabilis TaxID=981085 RepID=UPI000CED23C9|nr:magnesium transporter MRS2-11, chloroplastic isoform X1 [Morus notabilis]
MALSPPHPYILQLPLHSPSPASASAPASLFFCLSPRKKAELCAALFAAPFAVRVSWRTKCLRSSTEEDQWKNDSEALGYGGVRSDGHGDSKVGVEDRNGDRSTSSFGDSLSLGIREPVYEVVEVKSDGAIATRKINRRQLLKSSGLRPRDIRSVDPSLFLTNSVPSLLVREHAILLNLGSLRAIAMQEHVLIFDYNRKGGKAFIETLLPRLNPKNINGAPSMPFMLEVVEAALLSRIQRLEKRLMDLEPRVQALLEILPNRLTAHILEQLRISKQTLVELDSRAGALRQMLLDLLEDTDEICRMCILGRNCTVKKGTGELECAADLEKQIAEEEEEEIEMLLENYLQRCESCHGQAERLLDSAKEMEDSIAVNLSSRRLEVSRVELLLQVGTFCVGVGALVAGLFGMNLRSYLEEHVFAFWLTTAGIIAGAVLGFFLVYSYLKKRKIL